MEVKWENFMIAHKNRELQKTVSVDNLLSVDFNSSILFLAYCNSIFFTWCFSPNLKRLFELAYHTFIALQYGNTVLTSAYKKPGI